MVKKTGSYRPVEPVKPEIRSWPIRQAVCGEGVVPAGFPGKIGSTQKATRFWSNRGSANGNDTTSFCGEGKKKIRPKPQKHNPKSSAASSFVCCCWRPPTSFRATTSPAILPPLLDRGPGPGDPPSSSRPARRRPATCSAVSLLQAAPPLFRHYSAARVFLPCSRRTQRQQVWLDGEHTSPIFE
ncbi:unnamed protein product [Linum trigynum]|uniref:Uncharacterized protein n=1 Tax=Linum trigynum TaxID=586398 RepID=A0AAV2C9C1_9ROSI